MPEAVPRRPAWLRHWRALLLAIPGAGLGLYCAVLCSRPSPKCIAVIAPSEYLAAGLLGAVAGLLAAVVVILVAVSMDNRKASLEQRFPDSLVIAAFADQLTQRAAAGIGASLVRGPMLVIVNRQGLQFWSGHQATRLKIDAAWSELGAAVLGDPSGKIPDLAGAGFGAGLGLAYERLSIELTRAGASERLQFPVSSTAGSNVAAYCDAYDLRRLSRQINGYKSVHDRSVLDSSG